MSREDVTPIESDLRLGSCLLRGTLCTLAILILAFVTGSPMFVEIPFHFLLGWMLHAINTLPPLLPKWSGLLLPLCSLLVVGFMTHRFICWWITARNSLLKWHFSQTLTAVALLLLASAAAIAMSGIAHQSAWLLSDRWTESNMRTEQTMAVNNARQLLIALESFHESEGHYPNSFQELEDMFAPSAKVAWVETERHGVLEPFILLKPGGTRPLEEDIPLIVSPVIRNGEKIVVGYSDGSVSSLPAVRLDEILQGGGRRKSEAFRYDHE